MREWMLLVFFLGKAFDHFGSGAMAEPPALIHFHTRDVMPGAERLGPCWASCAAAAAIPA